MSFIILTPFLFIAVPFAIALVVGLIVLLIKGPAAVRWILAMFLLLILVGFFGMFFISIPRAVHQPDIRPTMLTEQGVEVPSQPSVVQPARDPVVWNEGMEEQLTPNVYSSLSAAAYGLGVQLQETISALPKIPEQIVLLQQGENVDIALLEQLRRGLKFVLPDITVMIAEQTSAKDQIQISLQVKDVQKHSITIPEIQNVDIGYTAQTILAGNRGVLQAVIQTADNKYVKQVEFDHRLWLNDTEKLQLSSLSSGDSQRVVITSDETSITQQDLTNHLSELAAKYLNDSITGSSMAGSDIQPGDVRHYGFLVDEYYQQFQGLSGPIWRGAWLLDVSPQRLQKLQQDKQTMNHQMRRTWAGQIVSLLGMLLLICILYAVVNAITKGYYSVISAILAIGLVLIFVLFLFMA